MGCDSTTGSPNDRVVGVCTTRTPVGHAECYSKVVILPSLPPMWKTSPVAKNQKQCICSTCFDVTHAKVFDPKYISSSTLKEWMCPKSTISVLPFHKHNLSLSDTSCTSEPEAEDPDLLMSTFRCFKRDRTSFEYSTLAHKAWHPRLTSYSLQSRSILLSSWLWVRHGLKIIRSYCSMSPFLVTVTFFATRSVEAVLGHICGTA